MNCGRPPSAKAASRIGELLIKAGATRVPHVEMQAIIEEYMFEDRQRLERKLLLSARKHPVPKIEEAYRHAARIIMGEPVMGLSHKTKKKAIVVANP